MSSVKRAIKFQSISDGDMSADIVGSETDIWHDDNVGLQVSWSGTSPVGVVGIEASNDGGITWTEMSFSPSPAVSGNSGSLLLSAANVPYQKVRPIYTRTSGTGTLQAHIIVKAS